MPTVDLPTLLLLAGLAADSPALVSNETAKVENLPAQVEGNLTAPSPAAMVAVVPVRIDARNLMGRRFRLVEARFVVGGQEVVHLVAPPGQELDLNARPIQAFLSRGEHALTAVLIYQGRRVGLFSYLGNYRYRLEQTFSFYLEPGQSNDPVIQVLARERSGMLIPLEKRPLLQIQTVPGDGVTPMAGVSHGTEVTLVK